MRHEQIFGFAVTVYAAVVLVIFAFTTYGAITVTPTLWVFVAFDLFWLAMAAHWRIRSHQRLQDWKRWEETL